MARVGKSRATRSLRVPSSLLFAAVLLLLASPEARAADVKSSNPLNCDHPLVINGVTYDLSPLAALAQPIILTSSLPTPPSVTRTSVSLNVCAKLPPPSSSTPADEACPSSSRICQIISSARGSSPEVITQVIPLATEDYGYEVTLGDRDGSGGEQNLEWEFHGPTYAGRRQEVEIKMVCDPTASAADAGKLEWRGYESLEGKAKIYWRSSVACPAKRSDGSSGSGSGGSSGGGSDAGGGWGFFSWFFFLTTNGMVLQKSHIGTFGERPRISYNQDDDDGDDTREEKEQKQNAPSSSFGAEDDAAFLDALAAWPLTQAVGVHESRSIKVNGEEQEAIPTDLKRGVPEEEDGSKMATMKLSEVLPEHYNGQGLPRGGGTSWRKRARFSEAEDHSEAVAEEAKNASSAAPTSCYLQSGAYDALKFGDFSTYMRNKRAKLKVQEHSLKEQEEALLAAVGSSASTAEIPSAPPLFQGCTIYINGHTVPPYAELRRLIVLHGGNFMAYLDQKSPVTHIVASNLTPKKRVEFAAYRVVTPQWITESIRLGKRLAWHDFKVEADAGGAIGSAKLPGAKPLVQAGNAASSATGQGMSSSSSSYLASGQVGQKSLGARAGASPSTYLADATPWGRVSAQKKLTGLQRTRGAEKTKKGEKSRNPSGAIEASKSTSPTKPDVPPALAAEGTVPPEQDDKQVIQADLEPMEPTAEGQQEQAPEKETPPSGPPLTPEDMEWLRNVETPPKPKAKTGHDARDVQQLNGSAEVADPDPVIKDAAGAVGLSSNISPVKPEGTETSAHPVTPTRVKSLEATIGTDPPSRKAAEAAGFTHPGHPYSKRPSNTHAARLLASPSWREQNTATSESFLSGFFAKSRLHYLSTWKGELKDLVSQALKDAGKEEGSQTLPKGMHRVIMHVDFDSFFVSVGLRDRPDLKDKPVVVCHAGSSEGIGAGENSTSEIASCNYIAREFGVQNGWSLGRARQLCPHIHPIPYDFEGYKDISIVFYALLLAHADAIEAVSVDEALIDVSRLLHSMREARDRPLDEECDEERRALLSAYRGHVSSQGVHWTEEKQLAEALRDVIRRQTRCEASIGIGENVLQARLATRYAKPGGSYHLRAEDLETFLGKLDIDDLQGVGYNTRRRFETVFGTSNIAELKKSASQSRFVAELGPKLGKQVWDKMYGLDRAELEGAKQRQSVGAAVNYGIRFANQDEAEKFVRNLSQEVSNRLVKYKLRGRQLNTIIMVRDPAAPVEAPKFLGHGICDVHNRGQAMSGPGGVATNEPDAIFKVAWKLIKSLGADARELRGIAMSCTKLEPTETFGPPKPRAGQSLLNFRAEVSPTKQPTAAVVAPSPLRSSVKRADVAEQEVHIIPPSEKASMQRGRAGLTDQEAEDDEDDEGEETLQAGPFEQIHSQSQRQLTPLPERPPSPHVNKRLHVAPSGPAPSRARSAEPILRSQERQDQSRSNTSSEALALPTMSQLDPSVLSELPPAIRREVLRESKRLAAVGSSASSGRDLALPGPAMTRSLSSSPAKARKTASPSHQRILPFVTTRSNALPPLPARLRSEKPQTLAPPQPAWIKDPSKATRAQLLELEIDYDVFRALPEGMQRETLLEHSRTLKGKEARSKLAAHRQERTLAEERRAERQRAAAQLTAASSNVASALVNGSSEIAPLELGPRARRVAQCEEQAGLLPRIRDRSATEEVQELLSSWIRRHAMQRPRSNDVAKFSAFLTRCIAGSDGRAAADLGAGFAKAKKASSTPSSVEVVLVGSTMDDLEKVEQLLRHWQNELRDLVGLKIDSSSGSGDEEDLRGMQRNSKAREGWWEAFESVLDEVNRIVQRRFGGSLRLV
ncbi:hypothetical protein BCV69DRAFT_277889 [Microstroma glucosiphilum]|uniref:Autophagy-related protein 27 n=1 Tax=Pseudomicrostroma glucosiphilum TaxID=1684307 RepID=A0A316U6N1_9BASI|nr:hypothetical protein BCV69DRAFT_277889 [Pseudomicrostroma glucosiphilum]PWN20121.1 hypothetical protein BCV69DRAFT_277889 [Pseudomicrostroma glucosiphilum]